MDRSLFGRRLRRRLAVALAAMAISALIVPAASTPALGAPGAMAGPVDMRHGYPLWYQDARGLKLALCLDDSGRCLSPLPDPTAEPSLPDNMPDESFWWAAESSINRAAVPDGRALLVLAQEAAFINELPSAGEQASFGRIRIRVTNLIEGERYTIRHPYGSVILRAEEGPNPNARNDGRINVTDDIGCFETPCDYSKALDSPITAGYLHWPNNEAPPGYIGDPAVDHRVVGSPVGQNFFSVTGLNARGPRTGISTVRSNLFAVQGKRYVAPRPAAPIATTSVNAVNFGKQAINTTSAPQSVTISNWGNAPMKVDGVSLEAGDNTLPTEFNYSGECASATVLTPVTVAANGGSCTLNVTFSPLTAGDPLAGTDNKRASLVISDNAAGTPHKLPLTGKAFDPAVPQPAVSPGVNASTGFPRWYQDANGVRLGLCLDRNGLCLESPPNAGAASVPDNFPDEAFWWSGEASIDSDKGGKTLLVMAAEAAFLNEVPAAGDQMSFGRIRIRIQNLEPDTEYTITHPYGVEKLTSDEVGFINTTEDIGCTTGPCDFSAALNSRVFQGFLTWDPAFGRQAPAGYVGDPAVEHRVVGGPFDGDLVEPGVQNVFRVEGPNAGGPGVNMIETERFAIQGKLF